MKKRMMFILTLFCIPLFCMQKKRVTFADEQLCNQVDKIEKVAISSYCQTIRPFKQQIINEQSYDRFCQQNFSEQCYTKKAAMWCIVKHEEPEKKLCVNNIPFVSKKMIEMQPFDPILYYHAEFKYAFLSLGTFLYNQVVPEIYWKHPPEQCYTKKATLFCVKK